MRLVLVNQLIKLGSTVELESVTRKEKEYQD